MRCSKTGCYSITSSARARTLGGTAMPRAFAVFKLTASSYLVGACQCTDMEFGRVDRYGKTASNRLV